MEPEDNIGTNPGRTQLFSPPETRVDLIDLDPDAELVDPGGGARVIIQVLSGKVGVSSGEDATSYGDGTLLALERSRCCSRSHRGRRRTGNRPGSA